MNSIVINKKQGFTQIENCVLRHPLIPQAAKLVYGVLVSYSFSNKGAFPGQDRIAYELQMSVRTVKRALQKLREHGLIKWERRGLNKTNVYYILEVPAKIKNSYFESQHAWKVSKQLSQEQKEVFKEETMKEWEERGFFDNI